MDVYEPYPRIPTGEGDVYRVKVYAYYNAFTATCVHEFRFQCAEWDVDGIALRVRNMMGVALLEWDYAVVYMEGSLDFVAHIGNTGYCPNEFDREG